MDNAYRGNIQVTRRVDDEQIIIDVPLRDLMASGGDFELMQGDLITVSVVARPYENYVDVEGTVEFPGRYQLSNGMRIVDLVTRANLGPKYSPLCCLLLSLTPITWQFLTTFKNNCCTLKLTE